MKPVKYHLLMLLGFSFNALFVYGLFMFNHPSDYSMKASAVFSGMYCIYWALYTLLLKSMGVLKK